MKTVVLDNVERVEYLDSLTKGRLNSIQVIFGGTGRIGNYYGPGLRLAFALLRDQFPPQTVAERIMVDYSFRTRLISILTRTLSEFPPHSIS